jgi:hypothetical protein
MIRCSDHSSESPMLDRAPSQCDRHLRTDAIAFQFAYWQDARNTSQAVRIKNSTDIEGVLSGHRTGLHRQSAIEPTTCVVQFKVSRHNMRAAAHIFSLLTFALMAGVTSAQSVVINTTPEKASYPWITQLSQGPIDWFEKDENATVQGRAYRVVVLVSEIYYTVLIEQVTLGREGCCKKVARSRQVDLSAFVAKYQFAGELTGFKFVRWVGPTSFVFSYKEREFVMSEINQTKVKIEPYAGG